MSSRFQDHRRRSHSASRSVLFPRHSPDDSWRAASKRTYPAHSLSSANDSFTPQKWDMDTWRRAKRRRQSNSSSNLGLFLTSERQNATAVPTPVFAATSAEFHLFPKMERPTSRSRRSARSVETDIASTEFQTDSHTELTRLRSNAFWELQRSVAENGEGLVRRMRDYEHSRARSHVLNKAKEAQKRGRKRVSIPLRKPPTFMQTSDMSDDDDDVHIFAGEVSASSFSRNHFHQKRTSSLNIVDHNTRNLDYSSSPDMTCDSGSSICQSDDVDLHISGALQSVSVSSSMSNTPPYVYPSIPALSHTPSDSAISSPPSSPLPLSSLSLTRPEHISTSATSSEKAIAALSLALASGAGGLNDYSSLHAIHTRQHGEEGDIGELWH